VIDGRIMTLTTAALPDWILPASASGDVVQAPAELSPDLKPHYTLITIPVHESSVFGSIPDPDVYAYRTATTLGPFPIYRLNSNTNEVK